MAARGPCAVRSVVDGVTKCHCVLGTVKQWHRGVDEPYAGCDVCDAYRCKKDAGVKTEKTGHGHKRQRTATAEPDFGSSAPMPPIPFELIEMFGIVGHRLFDADGVRCGMTIDSDAALCEELMPANFRIKLLVRGRFRIAGRAADPGKIDTRWVLQSELVSKFSGHAGYGFVAGLADCYVRTVIDLFEPRIRHCSRNRDGSGSNGSGSNGSGSTGSGSNGGSSDGGSSDSGG